MPSDLPEGFYREELNRCVWEVPQRYTELSPIGTGAYGQVCSAKDSVTGGEVAIKKLSRPFQSQMHAKRAYREIRLLQHMCHENVISLLDLFTPNVDLASFADVYLVTCRMGADLNSILKCQKLTDEHVQFLVYQILRGLKYIHSAGVIHRDLKPSNLAVNENCELKILDFGLARISDDTMTGYVATRWYRAPEIMLNWMQYDTKVDIWSVGCIMGELLTGKTMFQGDDYIDQITKIMELLGKPSSDFLSRINSANARLYVETMPAYERQDFRTICPKATAAACDLLNKMLELDPTKRITAEECLQHPYLETYHDPDDEPTAPTFDEKSVTFSNETTIEQIKELMFKEVKEFVYHPPPEDMAYGDA